MEKLLPSWLVSYADEVIKKYNIDSSHDQTHFHNTAEYAWKIVNSSEFSGHAFNSDFIISGFEPHDAIEIVILAAYSHDLIDSKYMNEEEGIENLRAIFELHDYPSDKFEVVLYIITHISFSKRRLREQNGLPLFEDHPYKFAAQIVCDADQLDAYRVDRVLEYQRTHPNGKPWKRWCKTLLVMRVLRYISDYMNTEPAKRLASVMHDSVQRIVDDEFADVEILDY